MFKKTKRNAGQSTSRSSLWVALLALTTLVSALALGPGCAGKKTEENEAGTTAAVEENTMGDSDHGNAMGLQTVTFPYDSFVLTDDGKGVLKANADILKDKGSIKIQIEGHCDSRGGIQYNIALGEKRANAVKKYLMDLGIAGDRINTISYGKERLLDPGSTEEAHARNRRGNFVITSR